ncbi:MAG: hypothetical protein J5824_10765, partial [Lachnospiraceae bacterium]|nr:hypothetical protein [Lachnospiraceae bacterium]
MKNIIRYFKLLKFGLQARTMIILSLFFLALGIFYEMIDFNSNGLIPFSGLYLGISGMYIYQVVITSSVSALVQVSPFKKKLQCGVPAAFTAVCICITFTIFVVLRLTVGMPRALNENPAADTTIFYIHIMTTAIMLAFIFLYFSFSYRYYVVATIILCIALFPALLIFMRADFPVEEAIISALTKVV